jgi:predicted O-methyltransferase YrrM
MNINNHELWCSEGHFNVNQAILVNYLSLKHKPKYVLETGFCTGRSALSVLLNCDTIINFVNIDINYDYINPNGRIMVNKFINYFPQFKCYEKDSNIFLTGQFIKKEFPNGIDWFTVDGDHSYKGCLHDLTTCLPYMNKGGIIIVDDYMSGPPDGAHIPEVTKACDDFFNINSNSLVRKPWNNNGKGFCVFTIN